MIPQHRILFLDVLRIFAFLSVLIGHVFYLDLTQFATSPDTPAVSKALVNMVLPLVQYGGAGVVVFFLVSGYIIMHVLQTEPPGQFLIKRAFRIYPLYMAAVLIHSTVLLLIGRPVPLTVLLPQLLLVGDIFGTPYALEGVEWTLRVEVVFYLVMAAVFRSRGRPGFQRALPVLLLGLVALAILVGPIPGDAVRTKGYATMYFPFLLLGSGVYLFEKGFAGRVFLAVLVTFVFAQYYWMIATHQPGYIGVHFAAIATVLFGAAWAGRAAFRPSKYLQFLSSLTFSIYLVHVWFYDYAHKVLTLAAVPGASLLALGCLFATCYLLVRFVEHPAIKVGARLASRQQSRLPAPKPAAPAQ